MKNNAYRWTRRDKWLYALSLLPFLTVAIGTGYLLATISIYLVIIFIALYLLGNFFQAGACTGCPYRGGYCPPIFGVYLGNLLSTLLYQNREFNIKFINLNAKIAEFILYGTLLFPVYWLFQLAWYFPIIYFLLLLAHVALFMPTQCEKCSYNEVCPGGIAWRKCRTILKGQEQQ